MSTIRSRFTRSALACLVFGGLAANDGAAQPGSLDAGFDAGTNIGAIHSLAVQLDGKILIGGDPGAGRDAITFARLLSDGSADPAFDTGSGVNGAVHRILVQEDGRILIAGAFTTYNGIASPGVARLNNDPAPGFLQFLSASFRVPEESGPATITVRRIGGSQGGVSVNYEVRRGTARSGKDFAPRSGRLSFADAETVKTFTVPVRDDASAEGEETIQLLLSHPHGGARLGEPAEAVLTIVENDRDPERSDRRPDRQ